VGQLGYPAVTDLQATVAAAADYADSHATAPVLLLQVQDALGRLAALTSEATDNGRRPYRIPPDWDSALSRLAYLVYLLADQTDVNVDTGVRELARMITSETVAARAQQNAQRGEDTWI